MAKTILAQSTEAIYLYGLVSTMGTLPSICLDNTHLIIQPANFLLLLPAACLAKAPQCQQRASFPAMTNARLR